MHVGVRSAIAFPLILLTLVALITFWINRAVQPVLPKIDGSSRHDPDYIMTNFVTTQTNINGDLRYKLAAVKMRHFPDDDSTELERPRYTQFAVNKPYTQVEGLRGYVSTDGEEVQLVDNVKVTRQAFKDKGEMTLETDYLNIRPNEELITTKSPVVIKQAPKTVIYATGMIYEKKKQTLTLLNRVRAHYEKPPRAAGASGRAKTSSKTKAQAVVKENGSKASVKNSRVTTQNSKSNERIRRRYD